MHRNATRITTDATRTCMCLKMDIAKTKMMVGCNTPIDVNNMLIENCEWYAYSGQPCSIKGNNNNNEIQRRITAGWAACQTTWSLRTPWSLQKQPCHLSEETSVRLLYYDTWCRYLDTRQTSSLQHRPNMEIRMLNIIYKPGRKTNIYVRERTKVIDIISNFRKKWSGHMQGTSTASKTTDGHRVPPFGDNSIRKDDKRDQPSDGETTWTHTGATRSGTAQERLTWRRHAEVFAQPRDTTADQLRWWWTWLLMLHKTHCVMHWTCHRHLIPSTTKNVSDVIKDWLVYSYMFDS